MLPLVPGSLVSLTALAVVGFLIESAALLLALLSGALAAAVSSAVARGLNAQPGLVFCAPGRGGVVTGSVAGPQCLPAY
jgi:hypothetical protein